MGQFWSRKTTPTNPEPTTTLATTTTTATATLAQKDYVKYASVGSALFVLLVLCLAICLYLIYKKKNQKRKDPDIFQKVGAKDEKNFERPTHSFEYATVRSKVDDTQYAAVQKYQTQDPKDTGLERPKEDVANTPSVVYSTLIFEVESQPSTLRLPE